MYKRQHQWLVTVHFPDDLVVTDDRFIEVGHLAPVARRRLPASGRVQVPVDRTAEFERGEAEEVVAAFERGIGFRHQAGAFGWTLVVHRLEVRLGEGRPGKGWLEADAGRCARGGNCAQTLQLDAEDLTAAVKELLGAPAAKATQEDRSMVVWGGW